MRLSRARSLFDTMGITGALHLLSRIFSRLLFSPALFAWLASLLLFSSDSRFCTSQNAAPQREGTGRRSPLLAYTARVHCARRFYMDQNVASQRKRAATPLPSAVTPLPSLASTSTHVATQLLRGPQGAAPKGTDVRSSLLTPTLCARTHTRHMHTQVLHGPERKASRRGGVALRRRPARHSGIRSNPSLTYTHTHTTPSSPIPRHP